MFPDRFVHLVGGQPSLRGHFQNVGGVALARDRVDQMILVVRIRLGDVLVQGRQFVPGGRGTEKEAEQTEQKAESPQTYSGGMVQ